MGSQLRRGNDNDIKQHFYEGREVQESFGVLRTESYRIIKQLSKELKANDYIVIAGRVSRRYLKKFVDMQERI